MNILFDKFEKGQELFKEIKNLEELKRRGIFELNVDWYSQNHNAQLKRSPPNSEVKDIVNLTKEEELELVQYIRDFINKKISNKKKQLENTINN